MRNKLTTAAEAVAVIQNGDTFCTSGFVGIGVPDELLLALEERFVQTGEPRDLTLVFAAGQGDGKDRGLNALGHDGLC
jgi:propionate CoA-transferase